jgi:hypothetical protein
MIGCGCNRRAARSRADFLDKCPRLGRAPRMARASSEEMTGWKLLRTAAARGRSRLPRRGALGSLPGVKIVVTGSAGHLGEALVLTLREAGRDVAGLDRRPSAFTDVVGSVTDRPLVRECLRGAGAVIHAATLHKPHVGTHSRPAFLDANVTGTLTLLEEAVAARVGCFVFPFPGTSTA